MRFLSVCQHMIFDYLFWDNGFCTHTVLRMLLLLLKPLSTQAWPWLSDSNNLMAKETLLYLDITTVSQKQLSSRSFSEKNFSNSSRNSGKSSSTNDLNSKDVLSRLCRDVIFKSTKHFKSIFRFWSHLYRGIEIILEGSKTLALRRIFDPKRTSFKKL